MAITELEILEQIRMAEVEQKECRALVSYHKKAAINAETALISANLYKESLVEKLRVHRLTTVSYAKTPEQLEIDRFRSVLPELLKKI